MGPLSNIACNAVSARLRRGWLAGGRMRCCAGGRVSYVIILDIRMPGGSGIEVQMMAERAKNAKACGEFGDAGGTSGGRGLAGAGHCNLTPC